MKRLLLIILLALFLPVRAWAVPQVLNASELTEVDDCDPCTMASMTVSAASAGYAGTRKLFCAIAGEDQSSWDLSGTTINAVAMTRAAQAQSTTDNQISELWYLDDASIPVPGDYTVSVDFTEIVSDVGIICWVMEGVAQGAPSDTDTVGSDSLNNATLGLTVNPTDLVVGVANINAVAGDWAWTGGTFNETGDFVYATDSASSMSAAWGIGISAPTATHSTTTNRFAMVVASWGAAVVVTGGTQSTLTGAGK